MLTTARQWLRTRQLAGDGRAGQWARAQVRQRQWRFVRRRWRVLATAVVIAAAATAVLAALLHSDFQRGFVIGTAFAGTSGALTVLVMQAAGTAPTTMGAIAEQWTASELRPLRRAGWRIINHVALQKWDIDHVLVGPGGVIAVETKWSGGGWTLDPQDIRILRAADQVRKNARDLSLWHPLRSLGVGSVGSVVFLGGESPPDAPPKPTTPYQLGDVQIVLGLDAAKGWRATVQHMPAQPSFDAARIRDLYAALDSHIRQRDQRDAATAPATPSLDRVYLMAYAVLLCAAASFLLSLQAWDVVGSWRLWLLSLVMLAGVGVAAFRVRALRLLAAGWLTGVVAAGASAVGFAIHTLW
jgi:nuclease-like protein